MLAPWLVEACSNAGCFGHGDFTDHSNVDVMPALIVGLVFVLVHVITRVRRVTLRHVALAPNPWRLVPSIFALLVAVLYVMETCEQLAVYGHVLGPTVWLGAPVLASLCAHATACVVVTLIVSRVVKTLLGTTLRLVRWVRTRPAAPWNRCFLLSAPYDAFARRQPARSYFRLGERAPPALAA